MEADDEKARAINTVNESLTNQTPNVGQVERIENVRWAAKTLAQRIIHNSEPSRQRSLAVTKLEESIMWAVKGIVLEDEGY